MSSRNNLSDKFKKDCFTFNFDEIVIYLQTEIPPFQKTVSFYPSIRSPSFIITFKNCFGRGKNENNKNLLPNDVFLLNIFNNLIYLFMLL